MICVIFQIIDVLAAAMLNLIMIFIKALILTGVTTFALT